ncbi:MULTISPECIES: RNA ligase (ATP) [Streptomyces]|uniref:RNA ligase domain-containing protein n=1 Tax=Streptomyces scabiei (strain 87.22) TaxID=680198 RepID=C9Z2V5_STRSW|nr:MULTISPECIES: RNA ligase (ATP) [Streptomyces]MBP5864665.1 RNA ligase (ATP) [Streptomyces sp. LBUM 1484]MBP5866418.1 RNA ligase (ATP) [Streptomyces sp. LBUM 1485]MBP5932601.1 RNA ligase (ATP) [Streptomyces sp. LBUM 1479]KFG07874.1 2'-5' RNA ligase [Streptomyces scabiei]MBP5882424.1 RNA ligase (ATP) [Streptomyces sp. LBUM 1487]
MSTLRVTAEVLTIHDHPNADALELAQVGLYRAVVAKGVYRSGDTALYIPEQSVLPAELIEELGLTGRLAGSGADRVKAVRLRGELSQGIVCLPRALADVDLTAAVTDGTDFAERLGIVKWVPPIPPTMSGEVESAPELLPWVDIENIQRYPDIFTPGEAIVLTEKLHGTACLVTYLAEDGRVHVSSKGFGAKSLALKEDPRNLYWRAVHGHGVAPVAARLAERLGARRVGIFGEVYGAGVQDLSYGADGRRDTLGYAVFDVCADVDGRVRWLDPAELSGLLDGQLPLVPRLYEGPYAIERVLEVATGRETVSGSGLHLREGVVIRPATERYSPVTGGRAVAKAVSPAYLTRKGGTEYE